MYKKRRGKESPRRGMCFGEKGEGGKRKIGGV
jgi:hypothetical protein